MKAASGGTLSVLASGQYLKFEFYKFALPKVGTFYFTNADRAITVGGQTYLTGLTIARTAFSQKTGLAVQSVTLTIEPQGDNPGGPVTLAGGSFLSQCRAGGFDAGIVTVSKGFFTMPAPGASLDVTPGIIPWFQGIVDQLQVGRFSVDITVNDIVQTLNVRMPRNIIQSGCVHSLFDAGCTLLRSTFAVAGSISGAITANSFNTGLTQANGYFDLGVITFTSGVLSGSSYAIAKYLNASGYVQTVIPFAATPAVSNTYSIAPGCDKQQATCTTKYSNLIHYRGAPFVPQPETLYDGGTSATSAPALGGQGGQGAGSPFGGRRGPGTYKP